MLPGSEFTCIRIVRTPTDKPGWPRQPSQPHIEESMPPKSAKPAAPANLKHKRYSHAQVEKLVESERKKWIEAMTRQQDDLSILKREADSAGRRADEYMKSLRDKTLESAQVRALIENAKRSPPTDASERAGFLARILASIYVLTTPRDLVGQTTQAQSRY